MSKILETLKAYQTSRNERYGIYIDDKPVFLSTKNVYASIGIAKKKIADACGARWDKPLREKLKIEIDQLIIDGKIEIKKV